RLAEAGDAVLQLATAEIHNRNAVIFELRNEHLLARRIEREVIDAPSDGPEWYLAVKLENSCTVRVGNFGGRTSPQRKQSNGDNAPNVSSAVPHRFSPSNQAHRTLWRTITRVQVSYISIIRGVVSHPHQTGLRSSVTGAVLKKTTGGWRRSRLLS